MIPPPMPLPLQEVCLQNSVISICLEQLSEPNPVLKQWLATCLGRLWWRYDAARWCGVRDSAHEKLYSLLWDEVSHYGNSCEHYM